MKFKFRIIIFVLLFPFTILSQQTNFPDSTVLNLQSKIETQSSQIKKLDSTITHLKNENAHLQELAEQDISHFATAFSLCLPLIQLKLKVLSGQFPPETMEYTYSLKPVFSDDPAGVLFG